MRRTLQAVGMAQDFYSKVAAIEVASKAKDQEAAVFPSAP
jgi:hypothetical protein